MPKNMHRETGAAVKPEVSMVVGLFLSVGGKPVPLAVSHCGCN